MLCMKAPKHLLLVSACAVLSHVVCVQAQSFNFNGVQQLTNQETVISLSAPTGRAYRLESTGNLPEWSGLITFPTNSTSSLVHTDSATPYLDARYYRAVQLTEALVVAGDHLVTTNGEVVIQPRNHATFVMHWNGQMIYVDPVPTASYSGLPKADLILVSHSHSDHFSTASIDAVKGTGAVIVAPQTVYGLLTAAQKSIAIVLGYGASTNVLGLTVEAVYAANSNHAPPGFGNGYVLTVGGKRIYVSGDTGNAPEIRSLTNIDVAFVCMNQPYTLTVSDATNVVRAMRPKVVYPYHYRDSNGSTANAALFKQRLGTDLGIEVRLRKWY
jgi:L-ascorbate metabolism protein UlaG (beta-lactamase superfamily)